MNIPRTTDAVVIGSGSGGLTVAVGLTNFGREVLMVERLHVGGDCTNVGCIPSKSLLHHAAVADRSGGDPATAPILERVRERRTSLRDHEAEEFGGMDKITLAFGHARLDGPKRVRITDADGVDHVVETDLVVLATGSKPRRLPVPGLPDDRYLTNEEFFEQAELPRHLVVVGAGAIGLELAVAARRLGSEVTVLDAADRILPTVLPEASALMAEVLTDAGIRLRPRLVAHHHDDDGLHVGPLGGEPTEVITPVDAVLMAVGRVPNADDLGLETVGVERTEQGFVAIDDKGETNVEGVWAVGDVTPQGGLTHLANAWGRRSVTAMVFPWLPRGSEPLRPAVVFTDPEVATIGDQPDEVPDHVMRITVDVADQDRAYTDEVARGVLIVDVKRFSGEVLGATIVAPRAGELLAAFSLAMHAGVPLHKWYGAVFAYPTYGGAIQAVIDEYVSRTLPRLHVQFGRWVKGKVRR